MNVYRVITCNSHTCTPTNAEIWEIQNPTHLKHYALLPCQLEGTASLPPTAMRPKKRIHASKEEDSHPPRPKKRT